MHILYFLRLLRAIHLYLENHGKIQIGVAPVMVAFIDVRVRKNRLKLRGHELCSKNVSNHDLIT
jgi:hypothetical protein